MCDSEPMMMFCGFPVIVATEPMFEAVARPTRYGIGGRRRRWQRWSTSGVRATQTTSLTRNAERAPERMMVLKRILGALPSLRLQRALARVDPRTGRPSWRALDHVLVWTHWAWFAVPHCALAYILDIELATVETLIQQQYASKQALLDSNIKAVRMGHDYARENLSGICALTVQKADAVGN